VPPCPPKLAAHVIAVQSAVVKTVPAKSSAANAAPAAIVLVMQPAARAARVAKPGAAQPTDFDTTAVDDQKQ